MMPQDSFINRELGLLDFNSRVLEEAEDPSVPLIERLKFIAIFSSNLDEFFMVRAAGVNQQKDSGVTAPDPSGLTPAQILAEIQKKASGLVKRQYVLLRNKILPELEKKAFRIIPFSQLTPDAEKEMEKYFKSQVYPVLTPVAVDPSHPFPIINNCSIEIAVSLSKGEDDNLHAFVEVPEVLQRFIKVKTLSTPQISAYVLLEDMILAYIDKLFVNCKIQNAFLFRMTRDMDIDIDQEGAADLLLQIEESLRKRERRLPIRLEVISGTHPALRKWLEEKTLLRPNSVYEVDGPLDPSAFFELISKEQRTELTEPPWEHFPSPLLNDQETVFDSIKKHGTISLFHPFQSFDPVVRLLREAAEDPDVLAIKQTLYRVSGDSPVIDALQRAAENKKQVTVIVELKARFDEEKNIEWARKLEESGAHVIYGIAGLKIHCKALLIVRREDNRIQRYVHLSTGNYNDKTARLYTDIGIFSNNPDLCTDIASLFNIMTGYSEYQNWLCIATAPIDLHQKFVELIRREARLSSPQRPGRIIAKMNSLVETTVIEELIKASHAGVHIDLIVRGICCLKPPRGSGINIISIVDRYLEHSRIYYFENAGNPEYFLSSADWMPRNLYRRIELLFPVDDPTTRDLIDNTLRFQLDDRIKGRRLEHDAKYRRRKPQKNSVKSQLATQQLFKSLIATDKKISKSFTVISGRKEDG
ncbi:MAG: polyphosphate kinase 1 [Victivallales bacterium]|nr:polyphosphate kinase 1 [Victivallales bacterium]